MDSSSDVCADSVVIYPTLDYTEEADRLLSLRSWPANFVDKKEMARYGFYYTGSQDAVQCFACHVRLNGWEEGDTALAEHLKHSPNCSYLKMVISNEFMDLSNESRANKPEYSAYETRLDTYSDWPRGMPVSKMRLADAGFYYLQESDMVECFHCGEILKNWESGDDPWEEHAFWYPRCKYVKAVKGEEFIRNAAKNRRNKKVEPEAEIHIPEEHTTISDDKLCNVCYDHPKHVALIPCGHVFCPSCAISVSKCPSCRSSINNVVRINGF